MNELKPCPCENCNTRMAYARTFDVHFYGDDCPYRCTEWERYDAERRANDAEI